MRGRVQSSVERDRLASGRVREHARQHPLIVGWLRSSAGPMDNQEDCPMTRIMLVSTVVFGLLPLAAMAADDHVIAAPDTLKWGPAPPAYPKGAEFAIITGNPGQEGPFV